MNWQNLWTSVIGIGCVCFVISVVGLQITGKLVEGEFPRPDWKNEMRGFMTDQRLFAQEMRAHYLVGSNSTPDPIINELVQFKDEGPRFTSERWEIERKKLLEEVSKMIQESNQRVE